MQDLPAKYYLETFYIHLTSCPVLLFDSHLIVLGEYYMQFMLTRLINLLNYPQMTIFCILWQYFVSKMAPGGNIRASNACWEFSTALRGKFIKFQMLTNHHILRYICYFTQNYLFYKVNLFAGIFVIGAHLKICQHHMYV